MTAGAERAVLPGRGDLIRIVPLYVPEETVRLLEGVAPAVSPHLSYRGGPLLANVEVFTVFWGAAWQDAPLSDLATKINGFFDFVLTSALMDQLAEYSTDRVTIGHGQRVGTVTIASPKLGRIVTDQAIQHTLQQEIATNTAFPQPSPNMLYFIYLPPGVAVAQGGSRSCQAFCGYHDTINGQIFYAAMPYPGCAGCLGGLATFDALTSTSSHELCEAVTDPIPGQGWYDDVNGEIGDICAWKTKKLGDYTVQLEWSNAKDECIETVT